MGRNPSISWEKYAAAVVEAKLSDAYEAADKIEDPATKEAVVKAVEQVAVSFEQMKR